MTRNRLLWFTATLAIITVAPGVFAAIAPASDPADLIVTGGEVSVPSVAISDVTAVTLDGTAQEGTATMSNFSVTDSRGTGAGWRVTVQATQFLEWNGIAAYVAGGKSIPANSLLMTAPSVAANGTSSVVPSIGTGPFTLDGAGAVTIASAALTEGMGKYDFTPGASSLTLSVPTSTYARAYRSDITVSVISGP